MYSLQSKDMYLLTKVLHLCTIRIIINLLYCIYVAVNYPLAGSCDIHLKNIGTFPARGEKAIGDSTWWWDRELQGWWPVRLIAICRVLYQKIQGVIQMCNPGLKQYLRVSRYSFDPFFCWKVWAILKMCIAKHLLLMSSWKVKIVV